MFNIVNETIRHLKDKYTEGMRVKLVYMNDPYNKKLKPGALGTVTMVDDIGTIHVRWDCGSSLGMVYGEDVWEIV